VLLILMLLLWVASMVDGGQTLRLDTPKVVVCTHDDITTSTMSDVNDDDNCNIVFVL
jgi:hypothetical protein